MTNLAVSLNFLDVKIDFRKFNSFKINKYTISIISPIRMDFNLSAFQIVINNLNDLEIHVSTKNKFETRKDFERIE